MFRFTSAGIMFLGSSVCLYTNEIKGFKLHVKTIKVTKVVPCRIVAHTPCSGVKCLEGRFGPEPDRVTVLLTKEREEFKQ